MCIRCLPTNRRRSTVHDENVSLRMLNESCCICCEIRIQFIHAITLIKYLWHYHQSRWHEQQSHLVTMAWFKVTWEALLPMWTILGALMGLRHCSVSLVLHRVTHSAIFRRLFWNELIWKTLPGDKLLHSFVYCWWNCRWQSVSCLIRASSL